ncbi:MAG: helix-turn-helix domain-containing protein [Candidatus Gracilibacteria bacterium]|jgi:sugar-specific transcriptional regulator TrmB
MLEKLIEFGLSEKEAKVYLALMELGEASVTDIARKARVTRTNTYHLLGALSSYGLVIGEQGDNKAMFRAQKPERLLNFVREKMYQAENRYKEAESLMSEFKSIYRDPEQKTKIRYFDGVEGVVAVYDDALTAKSKIFSYSTAEDRDVLLPGFFHEYYAKKAEKGIETESFVAGPGLTKEQEVLLGEYKISAKILPERFATSSEINIYDNKIAVVSLKEKTGFIVEGKEVAEAFKKIFILAYERAMQYDKKRG